MRTTISAQVLGAVAHLADRDIIHQFLDGVKTLVETLDIAADDKRLALTAPKESMDLRLNLNGRMVYQVAATEGGFQWGFMLRVEDLNAFQPESVIETSSLFSGKDGMFWYQVAAANLPEAGYRQLLHLWVDACKEYLPTQRGSRFRNRHQPALYEMAIDVPLRDEVIAQTIAEPTDASHLFEHFIAVYKDQIRADHNEPERYKWICTQTFQEAWDLDAPDVAAMLKAALRDRANLLYQNSVGFILKAARQFPEDVRGMFRRLFDEREPLPTRLHAFTRSAASLLPQLEQVSGSKLSHQQDERTLSFYLAMRFPQSYPLYRQGLYQLLFQVAANGGDERRRPGERFLHFLELGNALLPLIAADEDLQTLVAATLTDACWKGPQQWLIFQDILWRTHHPIAPQRPDSTPNTYTILEPGMQLAEADEAYGPLPFRNAAPLNVVFYGPPGTGKTYATIEAAVNRAEPSFKPAGVTLPEQRASCRSKYETLVQEGRIQFITFHQSLSYEDFIEGIKPQKPHPDDTFLSYAIRDGIFKELALRAAASTQPHVLIIDEINRGNVSQIFGELITLLEEDKRAGAQEALEVTLPYSGKPFSVPANLYLIGTMNTADRSVETLDTALRRRFSFVEMPPREEMISGSVRIGGTDYSFAQILRVINTRMEVLAGRDHKIGHSYFLDLEAGWKAYLQVFTDQIIPLLQEYFYGDYSRICLVLGTGFVSLPERPQSETVFARLPKNSTAGDHLNALQEKEVWALTNWTEATEAQFAAALDTLLNSRSDDAG